MTNNIEVLELLRKADATLSDESRWNQGGAARADNGEGVGSGDPKACQWCMSGAVWKNDPSRDFGSPLVLAAELELHKTIVGTGEHWSPASGIFHFNDAESTTFEMVKKVFADTIARLEKEGS